MGALLRELKGNPLLWLLAAVPVVLVLEHTAPERQTLLFGLSVLAIVPLAALLSRATESVAARTGDAVGGLLNATLGNLTELVIAFTALKAGQHLLVKASLAGAITTNTLFMLGGSFLLGGLKHKVQTYDVGHAKLQSGLLFLATIALLVPSAVSHADGDTKAAYVKDLSLAISFLLIVVYALGLLFSLGTHKDELGGGAPGEGMKPSAKKRGGHGAHGGHGEEPVWPLPLALLILGGVTVLVALVSEIFVGSVEHASGALGLSPAFVGFVLVALVGAAAEMASAFSGARKDRLNLSIGIALGSATQIGLFVAPVLVLASYVVGSTPLDLQFWPGAIVMMLFATLSASMVTSSGRAGWFSGVLLLAVYAVFALALYLRPGLSAPIRHVLFDFGDTLVREPFCTIPPPGVPDFEALVLATYAHERTVERWDAGEITMDDVVRRVAARCGLGAEATRAAMVHNWRNLRFNATTFAFAREVARARRAAIVTIASEAFTHVVEPHYALGREFVIAASCVERTMSKTRLCEIALERLGAAGAVESALLVDNRDDNVEDFLRRGGQAYRFTDDAAFARDLPAIRARLALT